MQTGDINDALIDACRAGSVGMITVLLDRGASVNHRNKVNNKKNLNSTMYMTLTTY
jgi:hypothetical protein